MLEKEEERKREASLIDSIIKVSWLNLGMKESTHVSSVGDEMVNPLTNC